MPHLLPNPMPVKEYAQYSVVCRYSLPQKIIYYGYALPGGLSSASCQEKPLLKERWKICQECLMIR